MRGSPNILALAAALTLHAGCSKVTTGADKVWPALVVVSGTASVPAGFAVAAAELRPARALTVRLVPYGGQPWDTLGVGRVIGTEGRYTISIPEDDLAVSARAFEAQALEPGGRIVLASPLGLSRSNARVERDLDPATTVVALAARRAGPGRSVAAWNVNSLVKLPDVKAAAARLAELPGPVDASAANSTAQSTGASGSTELRSFALMPARDVPPEIDRAVAAILKVAP